MIVYDLEFRFLTGALDTYQVLESRGDTIQTTDALVRLELHPSPTLSEEVLIFLHALASQRITRTVLKDKAPPDDARYTVEAGGSIRVVTGK